MLKSLQTKQIKIHQFWHLKKGIYLINQILRSSLLADGCLSKFALLSAKTIDFFLSTTQLLLVGVKSVQTNLSRPRAASKSPHKQKKKRNFLHFKNKTHESEKKAPFDIENTFAHARVASGFRNKSGANRKTIFIWLMNESERKWSNLARPWKFSLLLQKSFHHHLTMLMLMHRETIPRCVLFALFSQSNKWLVQGSMEGVSK